MTGPIIGSALFALLGYEKMFYVYGGGEVIFAVILKCGLSNITLKPVEIDEEEEKPKAALGRLDSAYSNQSSISCHSIHGLTHRSVSIYSQTGEHIPIGKVISDARLNSEKNNQQPSYCDLFVIGRYTFALISVGLAMGHFCCVEPLLSMRLLELNLTTM